MNILENGQFHQKLKEARKRLTDACVGMCQEEHIRVNQILGEVAFMLKILDGELDTVNEIKD